MFIIPQQQSLSELIGEGLGDIASQWAQNRSTIKSLKNIGFNDKEARAYAHLGPQAQLNAINARQQQQQQEDINRTINQILNEGTAQQQMYASPSQAFQQQTPQMQQMVPQTLPHERQQQALQEATNIAQNPAFRKLHEQQQQAAQQQQQLAQQLNPQLQGQQQPITGEQAAILQAQAQQQQPEPSIKDRINQVRRQKSALAAANLPVQQRFELQKQLDSRERDLLKESRKDREESREDQDKIDQETAPYYKEVKSKAKAAKESTARIRRMMELQRAGNLPSKYLVSVEHALDGLPLGIGGLWSAIVKSTYHPDAEEFDKLSKDFLKGAKAFFGSRMTEQEAFAILQTVPSLMQTPVGRQRVARNMQIMNDISELENKAMDEIIKENRGRRPRDLQEQVEIRTKEQVDKLYDKFVSGWWPEEFKRKYAE